MTESDPTQNEMHATSNVEEQLRVGRRDVDCGVRVGSYGVETPVHAEVSLREEHVQAPQTRINTAIADAEPLFQAQEIELVETSEELIVAKKAWVVEEIVLRKDVGERVETIHDKVRHTEVEVER